jgi:hypothetical protein
MSTDHRKPAVAFVALAFAAAALVGVHQADAQAGRFLAGIVGSHAQANGEIAAASPARSPQQTPLGQAFLAFPRPDDQNEDPSRTTTEDDQVSRTQDRPPVAASNARAKGDEETGAVSAGSTERNRTSRYDDPSRDARDGQRDAGQRGPARRAHRAAEHAAVHEDPGSRRGRTSDEDR